MQSDSARRSLHLWGKATKAIKKRPTYAYKEIDYDHEIRVLKVYPGPKESRLDCRLISCPLLQANGSCFPGITTIPIKYTALSYHWGQDVARHEVFLFDHETTYTTFKGLSPAAQGGLLHTVGSMQIQNNLNGALRELRDEHEEIYVWSDALCIYQQNPEEKTAQVSHMHEVYQQADNVCIWLGDAKGKQDQNRRTFQFLRSILNLSELERHMQNLQRKESSEMEVCLGVVDLLNEDWFQRRWVIQELALATTAHVRCGKEYMDWTEFSDSIALFITKHVHIRHAFEQPGDYQASLNTRGNAMRVLDVQALGANALVTATNSLFRRSDNGKIQQRLLSLEQLVSTMLLAFGAGNPKDTIFAVLQIARDTYRSEDERESEVVSMVIRIIRIIKFVLVPLVAVLMKRFNVVEAQTRSFVPSQTTNSIAHIDDSPPRPSFRFASQVIYWSIWGAVWFLIWLLSTASLHILQVRILSPISQKFFVQQRSGVDKRIEPDYEKNTVDVYADFIEYCVETSGSLDILCRNWAPGLDSEHGRKLEMPSWILPIEGHAFGAPGNTSRTNGDSLVSGSEGRACYTASGNIGPSYSFGKNKNVSTGKRKSNKQAPGEYANVQLEKPPELPRRFDGTLSVKGFVLGAIEEPVQLMNGNISRRALEVLGWPLGSAPTEAQIDQIWRVLCANRGPNGINPPNWYRRACKACLQWFTTQSMNYFNTEQLRTLEGAPPSKVEFVERIQHVVWDRKCFRTAIEGTDQYVGLAPPKTEAGDLVCILFGCSVPVVLKKGSKGYRFVGECYIHGMMDGEAVNHLPKSKIENFVLR